jgi:hypothetical protein
MKGFQQVYILLFKYYIGHKPSFFIDFNDANH